MNPNFSDLIDKNINETTIDATTKRRENKEESNFEIITKLTATTTREHKKFIKLLNSDMSCMFKREKNFLCFALLLHLNKNIY